VRDQLALGARTAEDDAPPQSFRAYLWLPGWVWMMFGALAVVVSVPIPSVAVAVAALGAALLALMVRTALTVQAAPMLFTPDAATLQALRGSLADAGRHLQAVGTSDPYRAHPMGWSGEDPGAAERPWTELTTIRRTAEAVRRRALPAAKGDKTGG
jgi:hypothetical protein